jgi:protein-tyrosine phosphatase
MGNICRSPTAEAMLRKHLQEAGLAARVEVDSAGTLDYHVGCAARPSRDRRTASGAGSRCEHCVPGRRR